MKEIIDLIKLVFIGNIGLMALWIILIALPGSRLREFLLVIFSKLLYAVTGFLVLYILSPLDLIIDALPVIGQLDDAVALVAAMFTGCLGWLSGLSISKTNQISSSE